MKVSREETNLMQCWSTGVYMHACVYACVCVCVIITRLVALCNYLMTCIIVISIEVLYTCKFLELLRLS